MNSGYHGTNGLSTTTSFQIYKTYVLPRLLYGLEILPLNKTHIATLEKFHKNSLRMIQSLPERTATAAVYLLLGALPVEAEMHKKQLSLLHSILNSDNNRIQEGLNRQISVNFDNTDSFFYRVLKVLELYNLPDIISLNQELPTKTAWKSLVNRTIMRTGEIHYYKTLNVNQNLNSLLMITFPWERYIRYESLLKILSQTLGRR